MTVVLAARFKDRNALVSDIFVDDDNGRFSTAEKVFPCSWRADTFIAGMGDELFLLILRNAIGEAQKLGWPELSSLDLRNAGSLDRLAKMATDYRQLLRKHNRTPRQNTFTLYVVDRTDVARWHFEADDKDVYRLMVRDPELAAEGWGFMDAGWSASPLRLELMLPEQSMDDLASFLETRSDRLPYLINGGVTGLILPHKPTEAPITRCICSLTLEQRTPKMRPPEVPTRGR